MLGLILNETCGMANTPQAWTLAAAEETTRNNILDHFVVVNKMVKLGSGSELEIEIILSLGTILNYSSSSVR